MFTRKMMATKILAFPEKLCFTSSMLSLLCDLQPHLGCQCLMDAHFRISAEVIGQEVIGPVSFRLLFYKYYKF